jgi:hypothetical protein
MANIDKKVDKLFGKEKRNFTGNGSPRTATKARVISLEEFYKVPKK